MDYIGKECTLLYKKNISVWLEEQRKVGQFTHKDVDFIELLARTYKGAYDDDSDYGQNFILDGHIGSLYYTLPDRDLFSFTNVNGTVTTFRLQLEGSYLDCCVEDDEFEAKSEATNDDSRSLTDHPKQFKKVYICNYVKGSVCGRKLLCYAAEGHIFLIDLDGKSGVLIGKWPVDPKLVNNGCCSLIPYEPSICGAVTSDSSLVAISGPTPEDNLSDPNFVEIRLFDVTTHECTIKKMDLNPTFSEGEITAMAFNPLYPNLIYITFMDYNDDNDDDDSDDDDSAIDQMMAGVHGNIVLFDTNTEKIIARQSDVIMIGMNLFYETIGNSVFLCYGNALLSYNLAKHAAIILLDALSLNALATINLSSSPTVLQYHLCVSTCQSQLAIFKDNPEIVDSELKYEVEVYKIRDVDCSLKHLCRKSIRRCVSKDQIHMLIMLPATLRDYLQL